jgi:polyferredoxin
MIFGRFFCGLFCSFGAMQDLMWEISKRTIKFRKKIPHEIDRLLKYGKYVVLIVFIALWMMQINYINDPWSVFAKYTSLSLWSDGSSLLTLGGGMLLLIIIGSLFVERGFCRYLCPLGGIYAILAHLRL